jgi:hypothetical protein
MKTTTLTFICIFFACTLLFQFGCTKDKLATKPLNFYISPSSYLNSKKQLEQQFTIDTNGTYYLIASQGTGLSMYNTSLISAKGDSVFFPYQIGLIELYKPKDMIYSQMSTVDSGTILETAGELRVRAYQSGAEVFLRPGSSYTVKIPNAVPQNYMRAYYGYDGDTYKGWKDSAGFAVNPIFADTGAIYSNSITKFGWINCGLKSVSSINHNLTFTSSTDSLTNVVIFIYIPATKTVMQVFNLVSSNIPDGSTVKIIAIGVKASDTPPLYYNLYNFYTTLTVTASRSIEITMVSTTDDELTSLLNEL